MFRVGASGEPGMGRPLNRLLGGTKVTFHPALRGTVFGVNIILCASHFGEPNRAGLERFTRWKDHVLSLPLSGEVTLILGADIGKSKLSNGTKQLLRAPAPAVQFGCTPCQKGNVVRKMLVWHGPTMVRDVEVVGKGGRAIVL
ncbi:hypothetical protein JCM5353_005542 [Sporobolomyces roseus]